MTKPMMDLRALVEKSADADLPREMIGFAAERPDTSMQMLNAFGLQNRAAGTVLAYPQYTQFLIEGQESA